MRGPSILAILLCVCACGSEHEEHGAHGAHASSAAGGGHSHAARHGGVLVALGDEAAHVELTCDPATGAVRVWLYDHEVRPARSSAPSLTLTLEDGRAIELAAVASALTGESVGDTSFFEGAAPELVGAGELAGELSPVVVAGRELGAVSVQWTASE